MIERIHPRATTVIPEVLGDPNSGLPTGAVLYEGQEANAVLENYWGKKIKEASRSRQDRAGFGKALKTFQNAGFLCTESGKNNTHFNGQIHPVVQGITWHRGFGFQHATTEAEVFIFSGWKQPWREGGAPNPLIYTRNNATIGMVNQIAQLYVEADGNLAGSNLP